MVGRTEAHHGGVLSSINILPTPVPGVWALRSQSTIWPSIEAVISISGENVAYKLGSRTGGAFLGTELEGTRDALGPVPGKDKSDLDVDCFWDAGVCRAASVSGSSSKRGS